MSPKKTAFHTAATVADSPPTDSARNSADGISNSRAEAATADAKRLKKRETDRRCQREARQRTKSRIAYLEGLVEELRRQDTSGQVASLMTQLTETRKERDMFARTLRGVEESVRGCWLGGPDCDAMGDTNGMVMGVTNSNDPQSVDINASTFAGAWADGKRGRSDVMSMSDETKNHNHLQQNAESPFGVDTSMMQDCAPIHIKTSDTPVPDQGLEVDLDGASIDAQQLPSSPSGHLKLPGASSLHSTGFAPPSPGSSLHCSRCDPSHAPPRMQTPLPNVWAFANRVMGQTPTILPRSVLDWEDRMAGDIPARALNEGWAMAEQCAGGKLPPLWAKLRQIDEKVFCDLGKVERLAILLIMHRMMRYHSEGASSDGNGGSGSSSNNDNHVNSADRARKRIPTWYLPRPSQQITHSYAIDFFTWPGIRERFVFRAHEYCTNSFWHAHNRNLRILWPGSFYDCFMRSDCDGSYAVLPEFEHRICDIASWTMTPDFFGTYPEFLADITSFGNIRRTLMPAYAHHPGKPRLRAAAASVPVDRNAKVITQFENDDNLEEMMQWQNMQVYQPAKLFGYKDLDILPEQDLMWFQDAIAEDCPV